MANSQTIFFRHPVVLDVLFDEAFSRSNISCASFGASFGCEAYSAAVIFEAVRKWGACNYTITGYDKEPLVRTAIPIAHHPDIRHASDLGEQYLYAARSLIPKKFGTRIEDHIEVCGHWCVPRPHVDSRLQFIQQDLEEPFYTNPFDVILCLNVLPYIMNVQQLAENVKKNLQGNGVFLFTATPEKRDYLQASLNLPITCIKDETEFDDAIYMARNTI